MGLFRHLFTFNSMVIVLWFTALVARAESLPDFAKLAEQNSPAVVNISTTMKRPGKRDIPELQMPGIPEDSPLNDLLRRFYEGEGNGIPEEMEPRSSLGSGFILSKDGYVITNNHVVKNADEIVVRLNDRREFKAKVIGTDERSDLAVLKIEANDLPVVKIGQTANLKVGEWVLAIGSPFGFEYSVTAGIVSAKGRSLPNESYVPFIQTDVAINPGNSGGPLFNLNGEVVGVNSQIYSRTGGFMGLSFAIPTEVVMNVYNQLREKGKVTRGWLGVLIQDVTRELAESFGMDKPHGALVSKVLPNSPGAKAGIQPGDIITEFGGKVIDLSSELPPIVGNTKVGDKMPVKVIRKGEQKTLEIQIGELPKEEELKHAATSDKGRGMTDERLGIAVKALTDKQREQLEVDGFGVMVEKLDKGPAKEAGIRHGDVILEINNQKIKDPAQFKELVAALPGGKAVPVLIQRQGNPIFLAIKVPEKK